MPVVSIALNWRALFDQGKDAQKMTHRREYLPYGRHDIGKDEVEAVSRILMSDWLTTGPTVVKFEQAFARFVGAKEAIAVSNGTAALQIACQASGLKPGFEAITTPFTFVATANAVAYCGADPIFADIQSDTYNLNPVSVRRKLNKRTKAILPVDYAGHPSDVIDFMEMAEKKNIVVIEDAAHSVGAQIEGKKVGSIAHMTTFSFHPVKQMTTGEGGMVTTNDEELASRLRALRNHGIEKDARSRHGKVGTYEYDMRELSYNFRLTDIQAALGLIQLGRLPEFIRRRAKLVTIYQELAGKLPIKLPITRSNVKHAWHLYPVLIKEARKRDAVFTLMRAANIGVNIHYIPVYRHSFYRNRYPKIGPAHFPFTEKVFSGELTLPLFPGMTRNDVVDVVYALSSALEV